MNDEASVTKTGVAAGAAWAVVAGLLIAAWSVAVWSEGHWLVAGMLAATGCASSAVAATLQIRTYACRLSRLFRIAAGLDGRGCGTPELRSLR